MTIYINFRRRTNHTLQNHSLTLKTHYHKSKTRLHTFRTRYLTLPGSKFSKQWDDTPPTPALRATSVFFTLETPPPNLLTRFLLGARGKITSGIDKLASCFKRKRPKSELYSIDSEAYRGFDRFRDERDRTPTPPNEAGPQYFQTTLDWHRARIGQNYGVAGPPRRAKGGRGEEVPVNGVVIGVGVSGQRPLTREESEVEGWLGPSEVYMARELVRGEGERVRRERMERLEGFNAGEYRRRVRRAEDDRRV